MPEHLNPNRFANPLLPTPHVEELKHSPNAILLGSTSTFEGGIACIIKKSRRH